jgi:hypothetical protein
MDVPKELGRPLTLLNGLLSATFFNPNWFDQLRIVASGLTQFREALKADSFLSAKMGNADDDKAPTTDAPDGDDSTETPGQQAKITGSRHQAIKGNTIIFSAGGDSFTLNGKPYRLNSLAQITFFEVLRLSEGEPVTWKHIRDSILEATNKTDKKKAYKKPSAVFKTNRPPFDDAVLKLGSEARPLYKLRYPFRMVRDHDCTDGWEDQETSGDPKSN